jgi:prevent-host-death family protein
MARFSLIDLSNNPAKVLEAASKAPVEITRDGEREFVLLTADTYDRLARAADTRRRAFHADDAPRNLAATMLSALERDG